MVENCCVSGWTLWYICIHLCAFRLYSDHEQPNTLLSCCHPMRRTIRGCGHGNGRWGFASMLASSVYPY